MLSHAEMSISSVRMFVHKAECSLTLPAALSAIIGNLSHRSMKFRLLPNILQRTIGWPGWLYAHFNQLWYSDWTLLKSQADRLLVPGRGGSISRGCGTSIFTLAATHAVYLGARDLVTPPFCGGLTLASASPCRKDLSVRICFQSSVPNQRCHPDQAEVPPSWTVLTPDSADSRPAYDYSV
jgi:hypothetical protein